MDCIDLKIICPCHGRIHIFSQRVFLFRTRSVSTPLIEGFFLEMSFTIPNCHHYYFYVFSNFKDHNLMENDSDFIVENFR
jgi:hypothetical protein